MEFEFANIYILGKRDGVLGNLRAIRVPLFRHQRAQPAKRPAEEQATTRVGQAALVLGPPETRNRTEKVTRVVSHAKKLFAVGEKINKEVPIGRCSCPRLRESRVVVLIRQMQTNF